MDCPQTKELISSWMDLELPAEEAAAVGQHLSLCPQCRDEFKAYVKVWNVLRSWPDIEPEPGYVSRFWARLSRQQPWDERLRQAWRSVLANRLVVPGLAIACVIVLAASVTLYNIFSTAKTETVISRLTADDIDFVENMDIAENFDVIQNMDLLQDLDVIENMPSLKG